MGHLLTFMFVVTLVSFHILECNKFVSECFTKGLGKKKVNKLWINGQLFSIVDTKGTIWLFFQ